MNAPKVSVLMSVWNGERYLKPAVESILNQTFGDFEFLIVNDGSQDRTAEILTACAKQDARIKVTHHPVRCGISESLNEAAAQARGQYLARMDGDDAARPERFEKQVLFLDQHPLVAAAGSQVRLINEKGEEIGRKEYPVAAGAIRETLFAFKKNTFCHPAMMIRKKIFEAVGGYRAAFQYAQDYDLWLRLVESHETANLPETLLDYRRHKDQIAAVHDEEQQVEIFAAQRASRARREQRRDPLDQFPDMNAGALRQWVPAEDYQILEDEQLFRKARKKMETGFAEEALALARQGLCGTARIKSKMQFLFLISQVHFKRNRFGAGVQALAQLYALAARRRLKL
jgi:glycosyltransferase involved in cell wall biosynthesis